MKRGRFVLCAVAALVGMMFLGSNVSAQIVQIGEMNTQQIRALDLSKTVILMPGDIVEEHGPYLRCGWNVPERTSRHRLMRRLPSSLTDDSNSQFSVFLGQSRPIRSLAAFAAGRIVSST
jgi:hypothetical protein